MKALKYQPSDLTLMKEKHEIEVQSAASNKIVYKPPKNYI